MSRRSVTVNGVVYPYKVGRFGVKIDGVGYMARNDDGEGAITPGDIVRYIEHGFMQEYKKFPNKDKQKR